MITVIAICSAYGAAPMLAKALRKYTRRSVKEMYFKEDEIGFPCPDIQYGINCVDTSIAIFVGARSVSEYVEHFDLEQIPNKAVILTDSQYLKHCEKYNDMFLKHNVKVFAMPGILPYSGGVPWYHAMQIPRMDIIKEKGVTLSHSPGRKLDGNKKGTEVIVEACVYSGVEYDIISESTWKETLERKAKTRIFIDHVINPIPKRFGGTLYCGDMGKSGIEAMKLGCLVMTSGRLCDTRPYFPNPTIVLVSPETVKDYLKMYVNDKKLFADVLAEQQEWADKYLDDMFVAKNIMDNI